MAKPIISSPDTGFSLLEAVVGLAIVAMSLSSFYSAINVCLEATGKAREEAVAESETDRIFASLGAEYPLTEGIQTIDLRGGQIATLTIRPLLGHNTENATSRLLLLDIALTFKRNQRASPLVTMHTLRVKQVNLER